MRTFIVCLIVAALAVGGYYIYLGASNGSPAGENGKPPAANAANAGPGGDATRAVRRYPVRIQPIVAQPVQYQLQALGELEAQDVYRISAAVAGIVSDVDFNEGSTVEAHRLLCRISPETYQLAIDKQKAIHDQAVANLADAQSKYAQAVDAARINLTEAQRQVDRRKSVTLAGAVSPEELQQFQTRADLAALALKSAQENAATGVKNLEALVAEKRALWNTAKDDFTKAQVRAPIAGVIEERKITNGQYVTAGTPVAVLVDRSALKLRFKLPEQQSAAIHIGDTATFTVPAWPTTTFTAQVYFLSNQVDPQSRVVDCFAKVTHELERLKPGFFAAVTLTTGGDPQGVVVPSTALLPTEKGFVAFVVEALQDEPPPADGGNAGPGRQVGVARQRFLKVGLNVTGNSVEILDGLKNGEILVTDGASALEDGYKVMVLPPNKPPTSAAAQPPPAPAEKSAANVAGAPTP